MLKIAMKIYFDRLLSRWSEIDGGLPQAPIIEDVEPTFYLEGSDEEGIAQWRPIEKTVTTDLSEIEAVIRTELHSTIKEYFNSYWFANLGGHYHGYGIQLESVLPGIEDKIFLGKVVGYRTTHGDDRIFIPMGFEKNGLLVVVENGSGRVCFEEYGSNRFEEVAESLESLIANLIP